MAGRPTLSALLRLNVTAPGAPEHGNGSRRRPREAIELTQRRSQERLGLTVEESDEERKARVFLSPDRRSEVGAGLGCSC
ncbi:hypothetical protein K402DRAFT_256587 [Aulographum hederae CBS 113979]|uniref:Uncharacterized protein n=1 Tax=Aulographum hederae CBS 113979 TaxID=1176131 RepID=A0A6G1H8K0_9PEZI|nr:hypothetical protein K402DRAFT_256587 [Aulographum hederae CBS 113979]